MLLRSGCRVENHTASVLDTSVQDGVQREHLRAAVTSTAAGNSAQRIGDNSLRCSHDERTPGEVSLAKPAAVVTQCRSTTLAACSYGVPRTCLTVRAQKLGAACALRTKRPESPTPIVEMTKVGVTEATFALSLASMIDDSAESWKH